MYNDTHPSITTKPKISAVQILMVIATVWGVLILPIQIMELQKVSDNSAVYTPEALHAQADKANTQSIGDEDLPVGRVAGASTISDAKIIQIPGTNLQLRISDEIGFLIVTGSGLLAIGGSIAIYLIITRSKQQAKQTEIDYYLL